jgi:dienelactone hydrolase
MKSYCIPLILILISVSSSAQISHPVTFIHEGKTVYGTLSIPGSSGPYPCIVINAGTGANDRDGTLPMSGGNAACLYPGLLNETLRPYRQLAEALTDSGYAVLRYDKLEYTYNSPSALGAISFKKLWLPVMSAVDFLKTRNDIDTNNIILLGHSEGSSLIPLIARMRGDVKALISVAGPRTPFDSLLAWQLVYIADTCNGDLPTAQAQANQILDYFNTIRSNTWNAGTPAFAGVPAAVWYDYIQVIDSVAVNYNLSGLPSLFLGFGKDFNVPLTELTRFQNEISISGDFWSLSDLNHYMTTQNNPDVSAQLKDTILYWLRQNGITSGIRFTPAERITIDINPNPVTDELCVTLNSPEEKSLRLSIRNVTGQELLNEEIRTWEGINRKKISMKEFHNGIYIVTILGVDRYHSKKIMKH